MNPEKQKVEKLFDAALQFATPSERVAFIQGACGDNAELRKRVEDLLRAHQQGGSFLDEPPTAVTAKTIAGTQTVLQVGEGEGDQIGRYKLLQRIGEGGFGTVYMAEQQEPVRRKVALKIIKLGMDTREVVARFEAERQALALMDHPNIAQVLDGGATPNGRPYFVMELIKGVPITDYCDNAKLSPQERLQLFCKVCHAVQHAHQKGVIHRDLKPRNILVTEHDGEAVPKVIDFGVAKAIGSPLTGKTLFTRFEQMIGTPSYMSPEQTGLGSLDLDTRTDIYSLGVLLYELLTGTTPLERDTLEKAAVDEIRRMIRETQPPPPSTRLKAMGDKLMEIAKTRRTEPAALTRLLHGDLDWIVMKSLEKDRKRHYGTASELANDVGHHLRNEPVTARPPSKLYRFQKFVRRNRLLAGATAAVALSLILVVGVSAWHSIQEKKARLKAKRITQFLEEMLVGATPSAALGRDTTLLREIADKAGDHIEKELQDQPEVRAEFLATLAQLYWELGDFGKAEKALRQTVALLRSSLGDKDPQTAQALADLGVVLRNEGKLAEAETIQREMLALRKKVFGEQHEDVVESYTDLGGVLYSEEKFGEAESAFRNALRICRKLGNQPKLEYLSLSGLGLALADQGKPAEAEGYYREALVALRKVSTNDTPHLAGVLNNLAFALASQGKLDEAEEAHRRALELRQRFYPSNHVDVAGSMNSLALVLRDEHKLSEAEDFCRKGLAMRQALFGNTNAEVAKSTFSLAMIFCDEQKLGQAEEYYRKCLEVRETIQRDHWTTYSTRGSLGVCLADQKKYAEAEPFLVSGYLGMKQRWTNNPVEIKPRMREAAEHLAQLYAASAQPDKAAE